MDHYIEALGRRRRNEVAVEQVEFGIADLVLVIPPRISVRQACLANVIRGFEAMQFVVRCRALEDRPEPGSRTWRVRLKIEHNIESGQEQSFNVRTNCVAQPGCRASIVIDGRNFAGVEARQKLVFAD